MINEMPKRVSDKIAHMVREGKKPKQAVAIGAAAAHSTAKKSPAGAAAMSGSRKY